MRGIGRACSGGSRPLPAAPPPQRPARAGTDARHARHATQRCPLGIRPSDARAIEGGRLPPRWRIAGLSERALCRTRTGDPFLTISAEAAAATPRRGECPANLTLRARWRIPAVLAGACRLPPWSEGEWNFVSSSRLWPSGVCIIATSARTPSSPTTRSTERPSTGPRPTARVRARRRTRSRPRRRQPRCRRAPSVGSSCARW
jgi:hypothetical protein